MVDGKNGLLMAHALFLVVVAGKSEREAVLILLQNMVAKIVLDSLWNFVIVE